MITTTPNHFHHHEANHFGELLHKIWEAFWKAAPPIAFIGFIVYQLLSIPR
jgi:hypothetical protein